MEVLARSNQQEIVPLVILFGGGRDTEGYHLKFLLYGHPILMTIVLIWVLILGFSSWIVASRMRRRINKDLGGAAYDGDLTSIETWMKVDDVEEKAEASPNRDWVPKSSNVGFQLPASFAVVRPFEATETISGRKRRVLSGQTVTADLGFPSSDITIELGMTYLVVDFLTFSNCCKRITEDGLRGIWP